MEILCLIYYLLVQDRDLNWEKLLPGDWERYGFNPFTERKQSTFLSQILMSRTWSYKAKRRQGKKSMSVYHYGYFSSWITWLTQTASVIYQVETVFSSKVSVCWINSCINYFWWHDLYGITVFVEISIFNTTELMSWKSDLLWMLPWHYFLHSIENLQKTQHFVWVAKCSNDMKVN